LIAGRAFVPVETPVGQESPTYFTGFDDAIILMVITCQPLFVAASATVHAGQNDCHWIDRVLLQSLNGKLHAEDPNVGSAQNDERGSKSLFRPLMNTHQR
jgi:hypothetical protein